MRTAKYDSKWVEENKMGPNPLWLLEELCRHMKWEAGRNESIRYGMW